MNTILFLFILFGLIVFGVAYEDKLVKLENKLLKSLKKFINAIQNGLKVY